MYFPFANISATDERKSEKVVWVLSKKDHTKDFDDYQLSTQY